MTVAHICFNQKIQAITTDPYTEEPDAFDHKDVCFQQLYRVATLCNKAIFLADQEKKPILKRDTAGDASESAIFKYTERNAERVLKNPTQSDVSLLWHACMHVQ